MTLEEKVNYMEQVVLNNCPISRMALIHDLDDDKIENIYQIFEKYSNKCEQKEKFSYLDMEKDFNLLGIDYQSLKGIISAFYEAGKFHNVIWQYLVTNYEMYKNVSSEYIEIFNALEPRFNLN